MESLSMQLQPFFEWLLRTTLQASLLICLILLFQAVLRSRLGARWHYCLWLLLLIRMAMPWAPQSRLSVFNLIPQSLPQRQTEYIQQDVGDDAVSSDAASPSTNESTPVSTTEVVQDTSKAITVAPEIGKEAQGRLKPVVSEIADILPLIWLTGALALAVYVCAGNFNLLRIVKRERPLTDQKILDLLEDCKAEMGIRIILGVVATDKVKSPALFGFVRPRLLLPKGMLETLSREELRYVFLHELAHLKRHDIYIGWLISLLQVLHWFNPLIWLAFYRVRTDRELACDALVLAHTQSGQAKDYGRTIVNLLERFSRSQRLPAMAGILETKAQLKRRITMIARFKNKSYQWSPLAVILIIILACVSLPDAKRTKASETSAAKPGRHITLRQVWSGRGVDFYGSPSPDGRYLSYVDWETSDLNHNDLAIYEIATGMKRRLTNNASWYESGEYQFALSSRWSPDGKQIAYQWWSNLIELCVIGIDGSKPRILYSSEEKEWARPYDWTPDGRQILACVTEKDGKNKIVLVSAADGSVRVLKTLDKYYGLRDSSWYTPKNMSFSPDGRYIVYDFPQKEDSHDISLMSTDGSREIPLVEHPAADYVLGWAPDGKNIIFASDRTGIMGIWLIAVAEGKPQGAPELVTPDIGKFIPMGFTGDGSFYYCHQSNKTDVYITEIDPETVKIVVPPHEAIKSFVESNATPAYSPDGKYLAYISRRPPLMKIRYTTQSFGNVLCIRSLETGEEREFKPEINSFGFPQWSPDRRSIMVVNWEDDNKHAGHYRIDAQTGEVKLVVMSEDNRVHAHLWCADGKSIFLVRSVRTGDRDKDFCQIVVRDIESGAETELYRGSRSDIFTISRSPDGKWLAFLDKAKKRTLRIMPATGGEPREIHIFDKEDNRYIVHTWTADGKYILMPKFRPPKADGKWDLWRIPVEDGEPQNFGFEMDSIWQLSAHPDGRHIAFCTTTSRPAEVWVMENFLPEVATVELDHQPNFRKIRIPTKPGNGVLSPDGKKLAFVSKGGIWVVPVHGKVSPDIAGEPVRLPGTEGAWRWGMSWSADGKWIAYNIKRNNKVDEIHVISSTGGEPKKIPVSGNRGNNVLNYRLSLSPDGKVLAFTSKEEEGTNKPQEISIYTIPVEGGVAKRLTDPGTREPAFSPDGKKIAYVKLYRSKEGRWVKDIWVIPASGGTPVLFSDLPGRGRGPVWSPDGKMIAFNREPGEDNESNEIWIVPVSEDGKAAAAPTRIKLPLSTYDFLAEWTSDNKIGLHLQNPPHRAIYTVPASGGNAVQVTPAGYTFHPRWSPDGERIYFRWNGGDIASVPSEGGEISIGPLDADSKISEALPGGGNAVSPDGEKIVFSGAKMVFRDNKKAYEVDIYTIPIEGGEPNKLTISPGQDRFPCWSPDGKKIAFIRYGYAEPSKEMSICIVSTEGGEVMQLTSESHRVLWSTIAWSPDGKSIAYYSEDKTIRVIPVQGGESRVVVKVEDVNEWGEMAWSRDGNKIAYSSKGRIWVVSLDGGEPEEIKTGLDAKASHISWSPDGEKIAFTAMGGGDTELWLMENFLPTD